MELLSTWDPYLPLPLTYSVSLDHLVPLCHSFHLSEGEHKAHKWVK